MKLKILLVLFLIHSTVVHAQKDMRKMAEVDVFLLVQEIMVLMMIVQGAMSQKNLTLLMMSLLNQNLTLLQKKQFLALLMEDPPNLDQVLNQNLLKAHHQQQGLHSLQATLVVERLQGMHSLIIMGDKNI